MQGAGCIFGVEKMWPFHAVRWSMRDKRVISSLVLWNDNGRDICLGPLCGPGTVFDLPTKLAGGSLLLGSCRPLPPALVGMKPTSQLMWMWCALRLMH